MRGVDELRRVAEVYASAVADGRSPHKAVSEALSYSKSTTTRRLMEAKRAGVLVPIGSGKPGQVNIRALRVANALGIPYQALVDAVREHAAGDLRVPTED